MVFPWPYEPWSQRSLRRVWMDAERWQLPRRLVYNHDGGVCDRDTTIHKSASSVNVRTSHWLSAGQEMQILNVLQFFMAWSDTTMSLGINRNRFWRFNGPQNRYFSRWDESFSLSSRLVTSRKKSADVLNWAEMLNIQSSVCETDSRAQGWAATSSLKGFSLMCLWFCC